MKCLDRYISRGFGKNFLLFFIILNAFLCFTDSYVHLEKFLKYHVPFREMLSYYATHAIACLPLILPLTFVLTLIFTFIAMYRSHEILLLLSSGLGFFKITRIFWLFGFSGSVLLLLCNYHWIPQAQEYLQHYLENLEKNSGGEMCYAKHLTLNTSNRLWYINRYDKNLAYAFGISVCEYDAKGMEHRRITAKLGHFDNVTHAWVLEQGREILFHPKIQIANEVHVFERRVFVELNDSPKWMLLLQLPPQNLSLAQLNEMIDQEFRLSIGGNMSYRIYFYDIILRSIFCFLSCWVVLPILFAMSRANPLLSIAKLSGVLLSYGVISHIVHSLTWNGALYWPYALLIPFGFLLLAPLPWLRKLL
jgi:lipopolysaccharide export system permease protein